MNAWIAGLALSVALLPAVDPEALFNPSLPWPAAEAQVGTGCRFVQGFAALGTLLPDRVGACLQDQQTGVATGDASRRTSGGLLVWRTADNSTAFTDGHRTWLNGPRGVQQRLNTERYGWEGDAGAPGTTLVADLPAQPLPSRPLSVLGSRAHAELSVR
jgi:hypothetical protein